MAVGAAAKSRVPTGRARDALPITLYHLLAKAFDQPGLLGDELIHLQVAAGVGDAVHAVASHRLHVLADERLAIGVRERVAPLPIDFDHPGLNRLLRVGFCQNVPSTCPALVA
jgi:hypothetical protein